MAVVAALGRVDVVELRGPDARRFANGMFTNNVRDLVAGGSQRSAMTDDRGRLLGLLDVLALADDHFMLVLEGMSAAAFAERYDKYIVFDDVEMVLKPGLPHFSAQGADLDVRVGALPSVGFERRGTDAIVYRRDRGGDGVDAVGSVGWEVDTDGAEQLERLRILAGQVRFPQDIVPPALPHEHGLREAVLHFEKGCYLGQEALQRIDVRGTPRRALVGLRFAGAGAVGEVVADGASIGRATSCVAVERGSFGLAVVKMPWHEPGCNVTVGGVSAIVSAFRQPA